MKNTIRSSFFVGATVAGLALLSLSIVACGHINDSATVKSGPTSSQMTSAATADCSEALEWLASISSIPQNVGYYAVMKDLNTGACYEGYSDNSQRHAEIDACKAGGSIFRCGGFAVIGERHVVRPVTNLLTALATPAATPTPRAPSSEPPTSPGSCDALTQFINNTPGNPLGHHGRCYIAIRFIEGPDQTQCYLGTTDTGRVSDARLDAEYSVGAPCSAGGGCEVEVATNCSIDR